MRLQTAAQLCLHLALRSISIGHAKYGTDAIERFADKGLNLTFTLNNESDGHALHTTC